MTSMNLKVVKKLVDVIKESSDKNVVVRAMTKLRTDLVKDTEGILLFVHADGLKPLIKFLGKPHEQILEVALSIIANCCTENIGCREALDNKINIYLATILKSIPNALIQCRACRLLGNLAKYNCKELLGNQVLSTAQAVCKIIDESNHIDTKSMAFRAIRFLLISHEFMKHFINENGFILLLKNLTNAVKNEDAAVAVVTDEPMSSKVGLKRSQHREKYFEEVARNLDGCRNDPHEHELMKADRKFLNSFIVPKDKQMQNMIFEILRCLLRISEVKITSNTWQNLLRYGCSLSSLVFLASKENNHRCMVLKTLANFSKNFEAFVILTGADAIVAACDLLVATDLSKPLTESERRYCITLICMLSTDACHRAKIRRSGTLRTLITLLKCTKNESEKSLVLCILNNYQYDFISLEIMLCDGLVPVLIEELNAYLTKDDDYYRKRREEKQSLSRKRKLLDPGPETFAKIIKLDKPDSSDDSPCSSPRLKANSTTSSPASSSGGLSPTCVCSQNEDEEEEETYSPVCSDDDDEEDDEQHINTKKAMQQSTLPSPNICSEIMKLLDGYQPSVVEDEHIVEKDFDEDDVSQDSALGKSHAVLITRSTLDIVENLLFRVTLLSHKHECLGKEETLNVLIDSIKVFGTYNNFFSTLANILGEKRFFERTIKSGISHKLCILNKLDDPRIEMSGIIGNLTKVAESNYGKGELERFLRSDSEENQKRAAIHIAYIVKTQSILYQFLHDGNVLSIILSTILGDSIDEITIEAIEALTTMSQETLDIKLPILDPEERSSPPYVDFKEEMILNLDLECDMNFIVHNDKEVNEPTTVRFNKKLLCDSSEVFKTMLNSSFREGTEGVIRLNSCTPAGLRYFLNLIVCQWKKQKYNIPSRNHYELILEAFEMSRIYIMPSIERKLLDLLICLMNEKTCLLVLEWALKNYHYDLTEMAIDYYLCSSLDANEKIKLFRMADSSACSGQWFQLVVEAILMRCRTGV